MSKLLLQLVVLVLVPCLVAEPMVPSISHSCFLGGTEDRSAERQMLKEALAPVLASARIPFNKVKSAVSASLSAFVVYQGYWSVWTVQDGLAHVVGADYESEFHQMNSKNHTSRGPEDSVSFMFFAKNRDQGASSKSSLERRTLWQLRGFLSNPDRGDEYAKELKDALNEDFSFEMEPARKLLMRVLRRVQVSPAKAIAILEKGKGKAAVVKLPLRLNELKAILNSPAERSLTLFQGGSAGFLLVCPGSAGQMEFDRPMMSYPAAPGPAFSKFAKALGHSHPRFRGAEPSEPDLDRDKTMDTFILALVDPETIEVTLWRANETDYRIERGPEALKFLVYLGLLAPEKPTSLLSPLLLSFIAYLLAFGSLMVESKHLARSLSLIVLAASDEKPSETTTPHPILLPRAA